MEIFGGKKITVSYLVVRSDFSCVWLWQCTLDCLKKKQSVSVLWYFNVRQFLLFLPTFTLSFPERRAVAPLEAGFSLIWFVTTDSLSRPESALFSFARKHSSSGLFDPRAGLLSETQQFFKTKAAVDHQINDWDHMVEEWEVLCPTERRSPV